MGQGGRDQRPLNLRKEACQEESASKSPKNYVLTPIFQCQYGVESWNKWGLTLQINYGWLLLVTGLEIANGGNLYSTSWLDTGKTNAYLIWKTKNENQLLTIPLGSELPPHGPHPCPPCLGGPICLPSVPTSSQPSVSPLSSSFRDGHSLKSATGQMECSRTAISSPVIQIVPPARRARVAILGKVPQMFA